MKYFNHIEVVSEKKEGDARTLIKHLDINTNEVLMVGNALKSDVLPLIKIGASAIQIQFHITWSNEEVSLEESQHSNFNTLG